MFIILVIFKLDEGLGRVGAADCRDRQGFTCRSLLASLLHFRDR